MVLHHHHTVEDEALWPLLLQRVRGAEDSQAVDILQAMEAEHSEFDPMLEHCRADLHRLSIRDDEVARSAFQTHVVAFREQLREHLAHEETDAMRLVQQYVTAADWKKAEKSAYKFATLELLRFLVPWSSHRLPKEGEEWIRDSQPRIVYVATRTAQPLLRPSFMKQQAAFGRTN